MRTSVTDDPPSPVVAAGEPSGGSEAEMDMSGVAAALTASSDPNTKINLLWVFLQEVKSAVDRLAQGQEEAWRAAGEGAAARDAEVSARFAETGDHVAGLTSRAESIESKVGRLDEEIGEVIKRLTVCEAIQEAGRGKAAAAWRALSQEDGEAAERAGVAGD